MLAAQQRPLERTGDAGNAVGLSSHEHLTVTRSAQAVVVAIDRGAEGRGEDINAIGSGLGGRGAQTQTDGGDQQGEAWIEAIVIVVHGVIRPGFGKNYITCIYNTDILYIESTIFLISPGQHQQSLIKSS
ncbi:hypothetical protein D3C85_1448450 [compost metagenome]